MWCRDLTECLEREGGNHIEALEAFEEVNFEVGFFNRVTLNILLCRMVSVVLLLFFCFYMVTANSHISEILML